MLEWTNCNLVLKKFLSLWGFQYQVPYKAETCIELCNMLSRSYPFLNITFNNTRTTIGRIPNEVYILDSLASDARCFMGNKLWKTILTH